MADLITYIILVLAIAKLTLIIVKDDIFKPIRHIIFLSSPPENNDRLGHYYQSYIRSTPSERIISKLAAKGETIMSSPTIGTNLFERRWIHTDCDLRKPGWWGQVFSCPDCAGPYVALSFLFVYHLRPHEILMVSYVLAASMITSLIARRY